MSHLESWAQHVIRWCEVFLLFEFKSTVDLCVKRRFYVAYWTHSHRNLVSLNKEKKMSSALFLSLMPFDWTLILFYLVCSFIRSSPRVDPANLTGKHKLLITISTGPQGHFFLKSLFKDCFTKSIELEPELGECCLDDHVLKLVALKE